MNKLLFDISPIQDEDGKKKKPTRKKKRAEEPTFPSELRDYSDGWVAGFMMSIPSPCERCGIPITDLVEVRRIRGETKWIVTCGWICMHTWTIDPIPGLIMEHKDEFVLPEGRYAGQTLDQVWNSGHEAYVRELPRLSKNPETARAVSEWLQKKAVDAA